MTKGIVNERHDYVTNRIKYKLSNPDILEIVKVEGTVKNSPFLFKKDSDYHLSGNMIEWLGGEGKPDDHTPFFVSYRLNEPQFITDTNPGSVIRTIIESAALEIDFLYAQMNQIYNAGYIDTATGKSLDLVVSLLGLNRKKAGYATGEVTFGRKSEPMQVEIVREAHVYDGKKTFALKNQLVKSIKSVTGSVNGEQATFTQTKDFDLTENSIVWKEGGKVPDNGSVFNVDYTAYEQIIIPVDTRVSTYSRIPGNVKIFRTTRQTPLTRNPAGTWEVDVPVVAMSPAKEGNVFSGTVNVMPKPVTGIEFVINKSDIMNGTEEEKDPELRTRAKRALEMAGKATLTSLKSAVQSIEGVTGEVRVVDQPDGIPGIVEIIASGGNEKDILHVIDETRSAGIKVEFKRPRIIPLDIKLTILIVENMDQNEIRKGVDSSIRQYLETLNIDDDVILSRIVKSALGVQGVRDIRDVTINEKKENIEVRADEKGELRTLEIYVEE